MNGSVATDEQAASLLEDALGYAARGWPAFPCRPRSKEPLTARGFLDATTDPERITEWWRRTPEANVAVPTGPESGLLVLDVDTPKGGLESLKNLTGGIQLPKTLTQQTGGGGWQAFFEYPDGLDLRNTAGLLGRGLDTRGAGGYSVMPKSTHPNGNRYRWAPSRGPAEVTLAPCPDWILDAHQTNGYSAVAADVLTVIPEGRRNHDLASVAGSLRRRGLGESEIAAALLETNRLRCKPPLPETEVRRIASSYATRDAADPVGTATDETPQSARLIVVESWSAFREKGREPIPCLVDDLIPEQSQGMLAAPPKSGKTWQAKGIALGVSTGLPVFGRFTVRDARPVLYVALEGHRAACTARTGCLARGLGLDPDSHDLDNLHFVYKPRGINLADESWAAALLRAAEDVEAALVIIDVLRRAARVKENAADEVMQLVRNLDPLGEIGAASLLLHHFGKLTELRQERVPGERMAGSGAMHGALDVGIYITGTSDRGRRMRVDVDLRDLAAPPPFAVHLVGEGTGPNHSLEYGDTARLVHEAELPDEDKLKAPPSVIADYIRDAHPRRVFAKELRDHFDISDDTLRRRRDELSSHGVRYVNAGRISGYEPIPELLGQETLGRQP